MSKISIPKEIFESIFLQNGGQVVNNIAPRKGSMKNKDGSNSTHLMSYTSYNGKFYAYPTLFQTPDGGWYKKDDANNFEAFEEAKKRGELFEFDNEKEAKSFAKGSWKFQNGGQISKEMTGQFITELPQNSLHKATAEIEDKEYVDNDNMIKKAEGDTHENGGIMVELDGGDRVLSDHLKVGKDLAKTISKNFDIEVKPTNTYASVLDKFLKKIGHTEATNTMTNVVEGIDKQNKDTKDETTLGLNSDFLMKKLYDTNKELESLESPKRKMFDLLYNEQEKTKKPEFKLGGSLEEKYGIQSKQDGGEISNPLVTWANEQFKKANYELSNTKAKEERFKYVADNLGIPYTESDFATDKSIDSFAKKIQETMKKNNPELVADYGLKVAPTRNGLQYLVDNNIIDPAKYGIRMVNGKVARGSYDTIKEDDIKSIHEDIDKLPIDKKTEYADKNINDGLGYFRAILTKEGELSPEEYERYTNENSNKLVGDRGYYSTDTEGVYIKPIVKQALPAESPNEPQLSEPITPQLLSNKSEARPPKNKLGLLTFPDRNPLAPPSLKAPMKFQPRVYSGERVEISPDQALSEINRQQLSSQRQIDNLPDNVRASTLATMDANMANNVSKIVSETERYNASARERESYEDARARTQQSNLDAQAAAKYQQLMGAELEGYDQDIQNYYNKGITNNVDNWKNVEYYNRMNAFNPNVQFDGSGYVIHNAPKFTFNESQALLDEATGRTVQNKPKKEDEGTIQRKFKKRFGK